MHLIDIAAGRELDAGTLKGLTPDQMTHLAMGLEVVVVSGRRLTSYRLANAPEQAIAGRGASFPKPPMPKRRSTDT
jgi:hypothetical protein